MKRDTVSGILLIAGTLITLLALTRHPTNLLSAGDGFAAAARLAVWVHTIAIAMSVVVFLGFFGLNRRLAATPDLATAALVSYGFAVVTVIVAAAASGFVGTSLAGRYLAADETTRHIVHEVFHYNSMINQAFAKMSLVGTAVAIAVWSAAILRSGALTRGVGILGLAVGAVTLGGLLFGPTHVGVHAVLLYYLGQGAWMLWVGVELMRGQGDAG